MKTRYLLLLLVLPFMSLAVKAQDWHPVKFNQKKLYLHKHVVNYHNRKAIGITDTMAFGLMGLLVNDKTPTGQYTSRNSWGIVHSDDYFIGNGGHYTKGYRADANFWFQNLDSLGNNNWLLHTLENDTVVFSMSWPNNISGRYQIGNTRKPWVGAIRKIDTVINGAQDSALVFHFQTHPDYSWAPYTQMVIGKLNGLLQWRSVRLWTPELRPITLRKYNSDFLNKMGPGTRIQHLETTVPMFAWGDSTLVIRTIHSNRLLNGVRLVDYTDSTVRKIKLSPTSFTLTGGRFRTQQQFLTSLPHLSIQVPDTMLLDTSDLAQRGRIYGNILFRLVLPPDTAKPWILVHLGSPMQYTSSWARRSNVYTLPLDVNLNDYHLVEGYGDVFQEFSAGWQSTIAMRRLQCINYGDSAVGNCMSFSLINDLPNAQRKLIKLYPNPAHDIIRLEASDVAGQPYRVVNALGVEVLKGSLTAQDINVSTLAPGLHYLLIGKTRTSFMKD